MNTQYEEKFIYNLARNEAKKIYTLINDPFFKMLTKDIVISSEDYDIECKELDMSLFNYVVDYMLKSWAEQKSKEYDELYKMTICIMNGRMEEFKELIKSVEVLPEIIFYTLIYQSIYIKNTDTKEKYLEYKEVVKILAEKYFSVSLFKLTKYLIIGQLDLASKYYPLSIQYRSMNRMCNGLMEFCLSINNTTGYLYLSQKGEVNSVISEYILAGYKDGLADEIKRR